MAKKKEHKEGYGKLLDSWAPPPDAGEPVGCLATSFTFSPTFFEEECLGRFLHLETDAVEDGPLYLIEREEKLSQVVCACALVDQHHCKGPRSLRWDLLPARPESGILHAKISLLHWSKQIRVIIASANLTEDGYRRNQEVFGVLDFHAGSESPVSALKEVLDFLRVAAAYSQSAGEGDSPARTRWNSLLDATWAAGRTWGTTDEQHAREPLRVKPLLLGPTAPSVLSTLAETWRGQSPPSRAYVISPFFDPPGRPNRPAGEIWQILRKRGEVQIVYGVTTEDAEGEAIRVSVPESVMRSQPQREGATTTLFKILLEENRPLHAKGIWLEDDRWVTYMIGSSNFTTAGLGLTNHRNIEANLTYSMDRDRDGAAFKALEASLPDGVDISSDTNVLYSDDGVNEDDSPSSEVLLPLAFGAATYDLQNGQAILVLSIPSAPPPGWSATTEDGVVVASSATWAAEGSPTQLTLRWMQNKPPSGLWIRWDGSQGQAWWPVNVAATTSLPPPDELKNLTLEVLIEILTSARPLHQAMQGYLRRRQHKPTGGNGGGTIEIDPHKRVDTSGFLLQRTRRMSWALAGLRQRLERPAATEASLQWRIYGPVGVMALANATKESALPEERAFLIAELALELSRAKPQEAIGCLSARKVKDALRVAAAELKAQVPPDAMQQIANLRQYVTNAFGEALGQS